MTLEIVKIFTAEDNLQAEMLLHFLKDNHIPALKEDLGNAGLMNLYGGNSRAGANLYVAKENSEKARRLFEEIGLGPQNAEKPP